MAQLETARLKILLRYHYKLQIPKTKMTEPSFKQKIISLLVAAVIMGLGLLIFKFLPMELFGRQILYDASAHLTITILVLYVIWYFIDQNKSWHIPFFFLAFAVIVIVSIQRIISNAHNDIGLLAGLIVSLIAIIISRWHYFRNKFKF